MTTESNSLTSLGRDTLHVVIDMQRMFAEPTEWHVPTLGQVLPPILALANGRPAATFFTRFMTPADPRSVPGAWRQYYEHWRSMVRDRMDGALLELVEPLRALAHPENVFDKFTYSAFDCPEFVAALTQRHVQSLVLTGVETDVCVLATALAAVDRGLQVVVGADAVTSGSPAGHRAALEAILPRFDQQLQIASVREILAAWPME